MIEHQDDIDLDRNLKILCESDNTSQFDLTFFINKDGRRMYSNNESKQFASLMEREGLIRVFGDFCALERFGSEVYNSGGWLEHLSAKESQSSELQIKSEEKEALELENLKLQNEASEYQKSKRKLEAQISELTRDNLRLNNWDIRFRWLIATLTFIAGFIIKYLIDK